MSDFDDPRYVGEEERGVAMIEQQAPNTRLGEHGLEPMTISELAQTAQLAVDGGWAPRGCTVQGAMLAIAKGRELGLPALYSLQNIAVVNGKPAIYGDAMLAVVYSAMRDGRPLCEDFKQGFEKNGDDGEDGVTAYCEVRRAGIPIPIRQTWSVRDAKRANQWRKPGSWQTHPRRMLQLRARSFALRDAFPDVLGGLVDSKEAEDYDVFQPSPIRGKTASPVPQCDDPFLPEYEALAEAPKAQNDTQRRLDAVLADSNQDPETEGGIDTEHEIDPGE